MMGRVRGWWVRNEWLVGCCVTVAAVVVFFIGGDYLAVGLSVCAGVLFLLAGSLPVDWR